MRLIQILKNIASKKAVLLIFIILLGIMLRVIRALEMNRYDVDCYLYFNMAINWAKYGVDYMYTAGSNIIPPLLPFLMCLGYKFGIQPEITGTFLGILLGSLIPLCMFYIVNILFKKPDLALLAAFLGAVHPSLVRISVRCLRDSLYIPLVAVALLCAVAAINHKSVFKWCLFSLTATLASFTRYEGPELILIFLIWFFVEIIINLISKFKNLSTTNRQLSTVANIKYYCYSLFTVLIIFSALNLCMSYSLSQTKYINPFYQMIRSSITPD